MVNEKMIIGVNLSHFTEDRPRASCMLASTPNYKSDWNGIFTPC